MKACYILVVLSNETSLSCAQHHSLVVEDKAAKWTSFRTKHTLKSKEGRGVAITANTHSRSCSQQIGKYNLCEHQARTASKGSGPFLLYAVHG